VRILITGICGFAGSTLARGLVAQGAGYQVFGVDTFIRPGSESNRAALKQLGIRVTHADVRSAADIDALPPADWVIDAAANPSVLAGFDGRSSSRQVVEHNLLGTLNLLEYCKANRAGFVLLSTSRVYSIAPLAALPMQVVDRAYVPEKTDLPAGVSALGISEAFPTRAPISLYGATKLASEALALEYGQAFDLPVFINRCGVLAGAGQFGRPDQGIFSYWINAHLRRQPLKYIGFHGTGHQVRDCLHPQDIVPLLVQQLCAPGRDVADRVVNLSGGVASATSLRQLSDWCDDRFGAHPVGVDPVERPFDVPWMVLDSSRAAQVWGWTPRTTVPAILDEIAAHAGTHPGWLDLSAPLG
jgi:CDP-paratose 2-epimerase